ncbi:MAG: HAD-IIB family hydrolase [Candidatus Sulfomarinibacteraceae bacterium]
MDSTDGLFICLFSAHGLIRGKDPELGRDADTGGQVLYVLELARALSRHPDVDRVELMTRQILSTNVAAEYSEPFEQLTDKARIVRVPFGPHRYLHKESLWPYLPQFVDGALLHFRQLGRVPDAVHGHYPDAGVVGLRLGKLLGTPVIYTGHSLGRVKRQRLIEKGMSADAIESRYNITRRIDAEESVLEGADLVIASTSQEVAEQYGLYNADASRRMVVNAPGVNLDRFRPPKRGERLPFSEEIDRFLTNPRKPLILAVQRPDERKNLATLIRAYGENAELQERANLVLLVGTRDDLGDLGRAQRAVIVEMLGLIDRYDLYGRVAYPKNHTSGDVAELYRLATRRHGVFVNPALTEPFGLTLIEAAASGLPIVATNDGGPSEIVKKCRNGVLIDPMDAEAIAHGLLDVLNDPADWRRRSRAGIRGAENHFSWSGHAKRYLRDVKRIRRKRPMTPAAPPARMVLADRLLICDIDNTLIGDREATEEFVAWLEANRDRVAFGVATGRELESALGILSRWSIPAPDVLITSVGSEIHYGRGRPVEDLEWRGRIDHEWDRAALEESLRFVPGLRLQPKQHQRPFKLSYFVSADDWRGVGHLRRHIRDSDLHATVVYSHQEYLDLLPPRASKGLAVKHLAERWGFADSSVLVAGDSGNDALMLKTADRAVVVGNFSPELQSLRRRDGIYFADATHARGILEGIEHFGFLGPDGRLDDTNAATEGEA